MSILAISGVAAVLPFLLIVACPLMMVFMMRGMHSRAGHDQGQGKGKSLEELKDERDALNAEIAERAEEASRERWTSTV